MKPIAIKEVLDLAVVARTNGDVFNPLFTGDAGLGKSEICQQWVAEQQQRNPKFFFLDLRIAYMEAPDMIGFPKEIEIGRDDKDRPVYMTSHCVPEFWMFEEDAEGLILFEEPNRGTTGVMNCLMQVLTDRKIHKVKIPPKVIFASCINPDSAEYDVNSMDAALRNRFEEYEIEYDHNSFVDYIESKEWHENVVRFVKSGAWIYRDTKAIGRDGKYISPRTWSKVNAAERAGLDNKRQLHFITMCSILGRDIGKEYHKFCFDEAPVTHKDLLTNKKKALGKLRKQSEPSNYKGDMIQVTVESIIKNYSCTADDDKEKELIGENTMAEVAKTIPSDQAINLIKMCGFKQSKGQITDFFRDFVKRHPELVQVLKSNIVVNRGLKDK